MSDFVLVMFLVVLSVVEVVGVIRHQHGGRWASGAAGLWQAVVQAALSGALAAAVVEPAHERGTHGPTTGDALLGAAARGQEQQRAVAPQQPTPHPFLLLEDERAEARGLLLVARGVQLEQLGQRLVQLLHARHSARGCARRRLRAHACDKQTSHCGKKLMFLVSRTEAGAAVVAQLGQAAEALAVASEVLLMADGAAAEVALAALRQQALGHYSSAH